MARNIRIAKFGQPAWDNIRSVKVAREDAPRKPAATPETSPLPEKPDGGVLRQGGGAGGGLLSFIDLLDGSASVDERWLDAGTSRLDVPVLDDRLHKLRRAALRDVDLVMNERKRKRELDRRSRR